MNLETLIIVIVVTAAAIYAGRDLFRKARGKKPDCCDSTPSQGCDGCGMADTCGPEIKLSNPDEQKTDVQK